MKGRCSHCGKMITLRKDGTVRAHGARDIYQLWCPGATLPPLEGQPYPPPRFDLEDTEEL